MIFQNKMFQIGASNLRHIVGSVKCFNPSLKMMILIRSFYSEQELGVDNIRQMRKEVLDRFKTRKNVELHKINLVKSFPNLSIEEKRDQLKEFILIFDLNGDDYSNLKSMLVQHQEAGAVSGSTDDFGTSIMRMFFLLNCLDGAIEV